LTWTRTRTRTWPFTRTCTCHDILKGKIHKIEYFIAPIKG
jgi:hypothetical protein